MHAKYEVRRKRDEEERSLPRRSLVEQFAQRSVRGDHSERRSREHRRPGGLQRVAGRARDRAEEQRVPRREVLSVERESRHDLDVVREEHGHAASSLRVAHQRDPQRVEPELLVAVDRELRPELSEVLAHEEERERQQHRARGERGEEARPRRALRLGEARGEDGDERGAEHEHERFGPDDRVPERVERARSGRPAKRRQERAPQHETIDDDEPREQQERCQEAPRGQARGCSRLHRMGVHRLVRRGHADGAR